MNAWLLPLEPFVRKWLGITYDLLPYSRRELLREHMLHYDVPHYTKSQDMKAVEKDTTQTQSLDELAAAA